MITPTCVKGPQATRPVRDEVERTPFVLVPPVGYYALRREIAVAGWSPLREQSSSGRLSQCCRLCPGVRKQFEGYRSIAVEYGLMGNPLLN